MGWLLGHWILTDFFLWGDFKLKAAPVLSAGSDGNVIKYQWWDWWMIIYLSDDWVNKPGRKGREFKWLG